MIWLYIVYFDVFTWYNVFFTLFCNLWKIDEYITMLPVIISEYREPFEDTLNSDIFGIWKKSRKLSKFLNFFGFTMNISKYTNINKYSNSRNEEQLSCRGFFSTSRKAYSIKVSYIQVKEILTFTPKFWKKESNNFDIRWRILYQATVQVW